jgi:cytochrome c oxidase cbb3-type subunit II
MSVRTFLLGLTAAFGLPWLALIAVPYGQLKDLAPRALDDAGLESYPPPNRGLILQGQRVFNEQGCYQCHTQVVRPTYSGPDRWRPGWAGDPAQARETQPLDYHGQSFAQLGRQRIGPDLANAGFRLPDEAWHFQHLYAPRSLVSWSVMPAFDHLFEKRRIEGQPAANAVQAADLPAGWEAVPGPDAKALVAYLLSLRKDAPTGQPRPEDLAAAAAEAAAAQAPAAAPAGAPAAPAEATAPAAPAAPAVEATEATAPAAQP